MSSKKRATYGPQFKQIENKTEVHAKIILNIWHSRKYRLRDDDKRRFCKETTAIYKYKV